MIPKSQQLLLFAVAGIAGLSALAIFFIDSMQMVPSRKIFLTNGSIHFNSYAPQEPVYADGKEFNCAIEKPARSPVFV